MTAGTLLARALSAAGVGAAYGRPLPGVPVTDVRDPSVAVLVAHAHRAVHGVPAVAHVGGGTLVVPGPTPVGGPDPDRPGATSVVGDHDALAGLAPVVARALDAHGLVVDLLLELARPAAPGPVARPAPDPGWHEPDEALVASLARAERTVVLAGPGVVARGAVGGLRALAAAGRLGVLNTWGAKGVFPWQSGHHWATVGLQADDFALAGVPEADLVLAVGVDEREAPRARWADVTNAVAEVPPELLGPLAERWPIADRALPGMPPLRERLAAVTQAGWASAAPPLMPSLVTRHYAEALGADGLVAADPGTAGYWVARTFATTRLRSALVPAASLEGWAAACALVARLADPLRAVLAVVDDMPGPRTEAVLAEAHRLGVPLGVEVWSPGGERLDPEAHRARLDALVAAGGATGSPVTLCTDERQLAEMVGVAGPLRAWTGDEAR